jgi:hypothetical protein
MQKHESDVVISISAIPSWFSFVASGWYLELEENVLRSPMIGIQFDVESRY